MKSRIMYIERKAGQIVGEARIGRVTFSKTGKTLHYRHQTFQSSKGRGFKSNYYDVATGDDYWISGCKKSGADRQPYDHAPVHIDSDVREEYWVTIRNCPENRKRATA